MEKWRWNPDAKFIKNNNDVCILLNYAFSEIKTVTPAEGKIISAFSGLTIPFHLPDTLGPELKEYLVNNLFIMPESDLADYNGAIMQRMKAALHNSHGLIIMPTEKCNFRCTYCYESFKRGKMSEENAAALCKTIERMASTAPDFSLGFFGGEPLLWPDLVIRFSSLAFSIMEERGLRYSASISTNGYFLKPELFSQLIAAGVTSYQISLDGAEEVHDTQRVTIAKKPTFRTILNNLTAMAATDYQFSCVIRCNIDPRQGRDGMSLFGKDDLEFVRNDDRFVVDIHQVWKSDRETMQNVQADESHACGSEFSKTLDTHILYRELSSMGVNNVAYLGLPAILGSSCYAGKPNWFVIGSDLTVYKCTVVFDNEKNQLGHINQHGEMVIDEFKQSLWTGSNVLTDGACSSCHYRVPCGGIACPLTRFTDGAKACPDIKNHSVLQKWANQIVHQDEPATV